MALDREKEMGIKELSSGKKKRSKETYCCICL
jgi:hypothetical protein